MALPPAFLILVLLSTPTFAATYVFGSEFGICFPDSSTAISSTIQSVQEAIFIVSKFSDVLGGDFRLSNAIADCLDLLDFSSDELTWTLSASQNPTGMVGADDMRTWLGGALGNQDTCMEGFDGTNSFVTTLVAGGLDLVTSLVREILRRFPDHDDVQYNNVDGPAWLKPKDRKLLEANISADVVVAADGTGNFTRVMDAISSVPDYNSHRYVKTGVYQDTLYAHSMRQFYKECLITGTVDFIFGDGVVVFQNCEIIARTGLPDQKNTITAQGRKEPTQPSGFSIQFSNITVEPDCNASTYLGRPWKLYSRTVIMQSYMSGLIRPQGWLEWDGDFALDTLYYGEYMNYGPGAAGGLVFMPLMTRLRLTTSRWRSFCWS